MATAARPGWAGCGLGAALLVCASTAVSWGEDVTMTGFYPAPRAVYETLQTVGTANLANTAGTRVDIGPAGYPWAAQTVNVNGTVQATDFVGLGSLPPASGMVMIFQGACPVNWTPINPAWNGRVIRGGAASGATGGSATHVHNFDHVHGLTP